MKISIEVKQDRIFWDIEIGEDSEQGNIKVNTDNYFLLADIVSRFTKYRNEQVRSFKDRITDELIKDEISKRSKQEQSE
jgi:hypothetical protein